MAEDTVEWGAFGFIFTLGVLSFEEAKPRNQSSIDYHEKDEFTVADFIQGLRFVRGELYFEADYIRGRRLKTRIAVRADGHRKAGDNRARQGGATLARADAGKEASSLGW